VRIDIESGGENNVGGPNRGYSRMQQLCSARVRISAGKPGDFQTDESQLEYIGKTRALHHAERVRIRLWRLRGDAAPGEKVIGWDEWKKKRAAARTESAGGSALGLGDAGFGTNNAAGADYNNFTHLLTGNLSGANTK